jgi:hypothetical protein
MYYLPFFIRRYKTNVNSDAFVDQIRRRSLYKYNPDGYTRDYNPRGLIWRNEVSNTIYLKGEAHYKRLIGGVTAILIKDDTKSGKTIITTVAYHDIGGSMWILLFVVVGLYYLVQDFGNIWPFFLPLIGFSFLFGLFHSKELKRQKEFIEHIIIECEKNNLPNA